MACIDITLDYLFGDLATLLNEESYAFVMDSQSRLIIHPLLAMPQDKSENPNFVHMSVLEPEESAEKVRRSMTR